MPLFVCCKCFDFFCTRPNFIHYFQSYMNKRSICGINACVLLNEGQFKHFLLNFRFYYVLFQSTIDYIKYMCCPYKINQRHATPPLLLFGLRHQRFIIPNFGIWNVHSVIIMFSLFDIIFTILPHSEKFPRGSFKLVDGWNNRTKQQKLHRLSKLIFWLD